MNIFGKGKHKNEITIDTDKDIVLDIVDIYLYKYNNFLNSAFSTAFNTNPQAFRLKNKENLRIVHFKLDNKYIANSDHRLALIYTKEENVSYEYYDFSNEEYYKNFSDFSFDHIFIDNLIKKELNIEIQDIIFSANIGVYISSYKNGVDIEEVYGGIILEEMKRLIRDEGSEYQSHVNHPSNYYAKNAARYSYSLLDLSPIIKKVDDEDFTYQLDQAIAAYDNSLYLASCATLGVSLETLCKILLKENGEKVKDSDGTMLNALAQKLREKNYISYKFASRIDVCYKVRNLASHTSPGKVVQNDCHFILNTIHEIVDVYF